MVITLGSITPPPAPVVGIGNASVRDIVNGALRKIGKLAGGREPRTQDSSDALDALRGLYRYLINSGAFGRLRDVVPVGSTYMAAENERIFRNSDATLSIDLPELVRRDFLCGPLPYDEESVYYPNGLVDNGMRPPRDCSVVVISDAFTAQTVEYIYDGQQKLWTPIFGLILESPAPLSARDPDGLKALLAMQIVDEFGGQLGEMTTRQALNFQTALISRYSSSATVGRTEYC
jgi:hypothetical protein